MMKRKKQKLYIFVCRRCRYPGGTFTEAEVKRLKKYYKQHKKLPFPCAACGHRRLKMREARKSDG